MIASVEPTLAHNAACACDEGAIVRIPAEPVVIVTAPTEVPFT